MSETHIQLDPQSSALVLVDLQPDFMRGGTLPVDQGERIVRPIRDLMDTGLFGVYAATQDWHPRRPATCGSRRGNRRGDLAQL